ncbi:Mu transposase C-terminal domain-containing protein [Nonomuraea wenchangensis]
MAAQARWEAGGFIPRMPDSLEQLDLLLLTVAKPRKIHTDGIHFLNLRYLDPVLAFDTGEQAIIRYDPRDITEIRVYLHRDQRLTSRSQVVDRLLAAHTEPLPADYPTMCLRILQAAFVSINTLMLQDVLADPEWVKLLKPADRRGLPVGSTARAPKEGNPGRGRSRSAQQAPQGSSGSAVPGPQPWWVVSRFLLGGGTAVLG